MKVKATVIDDILAPLRIYAKKDFTRKEVNENPPLRAELFSTEQMEQHALHLASHHAVSYALSAELLLKELSDNEKILFHVNNLLQKSVKEKKSISPAAEWLLDNFYLIEDQIRIAKRHLPKGYSKGLPKLKTGSLAGFPRVYSIAIEIIAHSDGHIDINRLQNFLTAYQREQYLTLGELWAFPIMLRLALIENLSRVAARIAVDRNDSALANKWARQIIDTAENNPKDLVLVIADMARSNPPMVSSFVAEFARKLQWKGMELSLPLQWIEQQLAGTSETINSMVLIENQSQAADQVSVSNSINSLRFLAKTDWRDFVENMSVVEQTLRSDIQGVYSKMDFHTRDHYRHTIETVANNSGLSESDVARIVVDLARKSATENADDTRRSHVGYYLLEDGISETEHAARVQLPFWKRVQKKLEQSSGQIYTITAFFTTLLIAGGMVILATDRVSNALLILVGILSFISASHFALSMANWWLTLWIKPTPLPKLDFSKGIPDENRTMVIVPTLLVNPAQVEKLVEELEVRYLSNQDSNLLFGLLTDFRDAPQEVMPEDETLIRTAQEKIIELNRRYHRSTNDTFFLFHRPRLWNSVDRVWMGYERKRGKLSNLNHLLRGNSTEHFSVIIGDENVYQTVRYIITLDTDTQLPRDAAWKLVGLMAHPLNKPQFDEARRCVTEGYSIIQPRIAISLHGATRSGFTRLHENDSGIDPYTRVTSDVYQDIFGEGSFIGKGIYEIDAFEKALNNRFPENRILSHDLLEGSYARCGFASDIQFYEEYPSRYQIDINRRHRWIRGDWQIGNWFLPYVPGNDKRSYKNPISTLSRWKIFDNLRRSLTPIANVLLLIAGWTILSFSWLWTLVILAIMLLPAVLSSLWSSTRKPKEVGITQHINNTVGVTSRSILQSVFAFVCLPYEAFVCLDAILKTLWRIHISRKKLLEWNPSGFIQNQKAGLLNTYRAMWVAPFLATGILLYLFSTASTTQLLVATPFLLLWILSPAVVSFLDTPLASTKTKITDVQKNYLRELARKSWSFFENLVGPDDHWLPPDNLQQYPIPVLAHRTSPTNIGMSILANLSACDFGYATTSELIQRTEDTFNTLQKLERYRGHFYNWYDTQTLAVLNPRYISTVDSGNLAGHLLTFRQGLLAIPQQKIVERKIVSGLQDTLRLALDEIATNENGLRTSLHHLHDSLAELSFQLPVLKKQLENSLAHYQDLISKYPSQKNGWVSAFENHLKKVLEEINLLAPWMNGHAIPEKFKEWKILSQIPTLEEVAIMNEELKLELREIRVFGNSTAETEWLDHLEKSIAQASEVALSRIETLQVLANQSAEFADMEYDFLYDKSQHLLAIGYHVSEHHRDLSYYDLLASEARLSSFVAIAQGKIPQENWFALGRRLTTAGLTPVLLSWSGSMFEYLMPGLVMPTYKNTLLDQMAIGSVVKQIEYGKQQGVPWGISESCYNLVDAHLTYQYRAFGIPNLGFKRGLGQDLVIAPYATILALMVDPKAACDNLEEMKAKGYEGQYGFYEAIDYTPIRLAREQRHAIIKTFMVHHQGMSLLALAYLLLDQPMQKRFEADTQFQTALLLLQEQVPKSIGFYAGSSDHEEISPVSTASEIRIIKSANTPVPEVQLLSNGHYFVMLSNAGGGYSRWREFSVTRWREDTTCDNWGSFCYINDRDKNQFWSTTHQPTLKKADQYEAIFSQGKVEFRRRDDQIETHTVVIVSPEDDVEVRRIQLMNHSSSKRKLSVTSYGEVVLATPSADDAHPAFSNLFVQTEINEHQHAIICTRRPRSKDERPPWMFHLMKVNGVEAKQVSYETDRSKFIGRGNTLVHPQVMNQTKPLSGSQGSVLDPIVSIQYKITLEPGESAVIDMVTGIAETKEANQSLIDKYQDRHLRDRAFELSWTHSQVVLRQIGATEVDAQLYGKLASSILYQNPVMRAQPSIVLKNQRQQSALWSYSISGDLPIVLLIISDSENISLVRQLIKAKAYWQMKGLAVDLVILNEDPGGYRQVLQDQIQGLIAAGIGVSSTEKQGRIFVRPIDQVTAEDRLLFHAVARIIISDKKGSLEDQVNKRMTSKAAVKLLAGKSHSYINQKIGLPEGLQYFNETGGFSSDGKEYMILTHPKKRTPLPWINVIANPHFGTIVSENGASYTWFENAHEFRLTPWKNDPLLDSSGEAFYIRDEESNRFWAALGLPSNEATLKTKHGFGYSTFEYFHEGIHSETCVHVDKESAIKFVTITITNRSERTRKLTTTGYVEWVVGDLRSKSSMHISTEFDSASRALFARNRYQADFQNHVAFLSVDEGTYTYTTDRTEFIGRNGTLQQPEAMSNSQLSGKIGACMDACGAIQVAVELEPRKSRKIIFKIGAGKDSQDALATLQRFKGSQAEATSLEQVKQFWNETLGVVQVETPDSSINLLANGWLLYQVMACRLWGRTGFYQSGGAFGFRDQLQDVMALMHTQPALTRHQILLCASRQFKDGDVQHWWHPPTGRGVRTRCSDDYLWLPFVTSRYLTVTGDLTILNETVSFLQGRKLNVEEESYYDLPLISDRHATVYEHCKQSILHALHFGDHGLPLMGSGDWNDGMNMVGIHGKGESVWLAFFLYDVLMRFKQVATQQDDHEFVSTCEKQAKQLKKNIKDHAWDGEWYLRAFFDDGSQLGSKNNTECKIDAISQSWSVLSGGADTDRVQSAMKAVNAFLINREKGLIQLLNPPFDTADMDPGYIKGYVPGVRENGGQYTHAAIWIIMAFAKLGDQEKTSELLKMINPIHHGTTPEEVGTYKVEPYVIAADVYGVEPHTGRGGWTWYTGSAGWMYQLILESFLGLKREGDTLRFKPCIPREWKSFKVKYRYQETMYHIEVLQEKNKKETTINIDGTIQSGDIIPLVNDQRDHQVILSLKPHRSAVAIDTSGV